MALPPEKTQQIEHFLSSVLSQRGPSSLPYAETTKSMIRQHLLNLIVTYASLEPKTKTFTHSDGRSLILLQVDGTVPMPFQGVIYNIPIVIWLLESYPLHPPRVYVNPTPDMIIKCSNPKVSSSGLISLPYLDNWVHPSSNLLDLASQLSAAFSRDPPLYSRSRAQPILPSPVVRSAFQQSSRPFLTHHHQQTDNAAEVSRRNRSLGWWRWFTAISCRRGGSEKQRRKDY